VVELRSGRPEDAARLTALACRSKAHWGYDDAFLAACRGELTLSPEQAAAARVAHLATTAAPRPPVTAVDGFHLLAPDPDGRGDRGELLMLFVDPPAMGRGVGRSLLADAVRAAARRGWSSLRIESDPQAEGFYLARGATRVGTVRSGSVAGRVLPVLQLPVPPVTDPAGRLATRRPGPPRRR
jgi:GNAT superfamily N-acetyltransferase